MDKALVRDQSRRPKQAKAKKKQIKVVYISNPVRVKVSASQFRALVQGLTGRDSDLAEVEKILAIDGVDELRRARDREIAEAADYVPRPVRPVSAAGDHEGAESSASTGSELELFDGVFTPEMMENFIGLSPSPMRFQPQGDLIFRGLDVV